MDSHGVVNHAQFAHYFTGARVAYFRALGIKPAEIHTLPSSPWWCTSRSTSAVPARFDDHVDVWMRCARVGEKSLAFAFRVHNSASEVLQAEGKAVLVAMEIAARTPVRVPDALKRRIEKMEGR